MSIKLIVWRGFQQEVIVHTVKGVKVMIHTLAESPYFREMKRG